MTTRIALLSVCFTLMGCAEKVFVRDTPMPGKAQLYVYRPSKFLGAALNIPGNVVQTTSGSTRSFPVRNNKFVVTLVDPGRTVFTTMGPDGKGVTVPIDLPDNGMAFIRCEMRMGWLMGGLGCAVVGPDVGEHEVAECKRNELGD
jgi:hypothetical protein